MPTAAAAHAPSPSPNFGFLAYHDARLVALSTQAEEVFPHDPVGCLVRLRAFGEHLAKRAAANLGMYVDGRASQVDLVDRLSSRGAIGSLQERLFTDLRKTGNVAAHEGRGTHADALHQLRMARELAVWFQRAFGSNRKFDPGPFVPPKDPGTADQGLSEELSRLQKDLDARAEEVRAAERQAEEAREAH
ncbi:MAG: type I restriction-modification system endonuclease, partial [Polyangiaceae bacterium]